MKSKLCRRVVYLGLLYMLAVKWACAPSPRLFIDNIQNTYRQEMDKPIFSPRSEVRPESNQRPPAQRPERNYPQQPRLGKPNVSTHTQKGIASWTGREQHGSRMANGEVFNMNQSVAAHKTLPFGTVVKVTNLYNGRSTNVVIKDRGPFVRGRIIDVSYAAAKKLDMVDAGIVNAQIELVEGAFINETQQQPEILEKAKVKAQEIIDGFIAKLANYKSGN